MSALEVLEDAVIAAGLAGELRWESVARTLAMLSIEGGCPYCRGLLEAKGLPSDRAWQCAGCGRLHLEQANGDYIPEFLARHRRPTPPEAAPDPVREAARKAARDRIAAMLAERKAAVA